MISYQATIVPQVEIEAFWPDRRGSPRSLREAESITADDQLVRPSSGDLIFYFSLTYSGIKSISGDNSLDTGNVFERKRRRGIIR